jgi:hypothetical protein
MDLGDRQEWSRSLIWYQTLWMDFRLPEEPRSP